MGCFKVREMLEKIAAECTETLNEIAAMKCCRTLWMMAAVDLHVVQNVNMCKVKKHCSQGIIVYGLIDSDFHSE